MEHKVYYNGQETNDFDTLASWFQELKNENERLKREYDIAQNHITENEDCIHSMSNDMHQVRILNKSLETEISELKTERSKTEEVLKRYCGESVDAPTSTMVGLIVDDYFYQKAETENQVRELQKAEKTIDKLNTELVVYTDKVAVQEKWITELEEELKMDDKIIDDLNTDTVGYANKVADQRERINELEKKIEKLEKRLWDPEWCRLIDKLNEMIDKEAPIPRQLMKVYTNVEDEIWDKLNYLTKELRFLNNLIREKDRNIRELENKVNDLDLTNRRLKLENEKLNKELEERKNKRSPRWPSDVMKIGTLENKVDKLREENDKLKRTLEFCQKEASSAREHAHNVEVNAERIRKGLD